MVRYDIYATKCCPSRRSISWLISFMNADAVHGPEPCTINPTPPGVSRVLGTDTSTDYVQEPQ